MYIGQWRLSPLQSRPLGTSHSSPNRHQLPYRIFLNQWSEISSLSNVILVLGKARSCRVPNLGCRRAESPGWCVVCKKKLCTRCDACVGALLWWSCQSPVAHSCSFLNHPNSFHAGMFKLNKIWCRFVALLAQSFWMRRPHSTHAHSRASITPTD